MNTETSQQETGVDPSEAPSRPVAEASEAGVTLETAPADNLPITIDLTTAPSWANDPTFARAVMQRLPDHSPDEAWEFIRTCVMMRLNPLLGQIYSIMRKNPQGVKVPMMQVGIGGLALIAARTDAYAGADPPRYGEMRSAKCGSMSYTYPEWVQTTVYRIVQGARVAFTAAPAYWAEYYPGDDRPGFMWRQRPVGQLSKCSAALSIRLGFPGECGWVYDAAEMDRVIDIVPVSTSTSRPPMQAPRARAPEPTGNGAAPAAAAPAPASAAAPAPQGKVNVPSQWDYLSKGPYQCQCRPSSGNPDGIMWVISSGQQGDIVCFDAGKGQRIMDAHLRGNNAFIFDTKPGSPSPILTDVLIKDEQR